VRGVGSFLAYFEVVSVHVSGVACSRRTHYGAFLGGHGLNSYGAAFEDICMLALAFILILAVIAFTIACAVSWNLPMLRDGFFILTLPVTAFAIACAVCWNWQRKMARLHEKMDRMRGKMSAGADYVVYRRSNGDRRLTSTAPKLCADSKRSTASSAISLIGCSTQRTVRSSSKS
jgi:hypothetical protein